jgi:hypothetical protein
MGSKLSRPAKAGLCSNLSLPGTCPSARKARLRAVPRSPSAKASLKACPIHLPLTGLGIYGLRSIVKSGATTIPYLSLSDTCPSARVARLRAVPRSPSAKASLKACPVHPPLTGLGIHDLSSIVKSDATTIPFVLHIF